MSISGHCYVYLECTSTLNYVSGGWLSFSVILRVRGVIVIFSDSTCDRGWGRNWPLGTLVWLMKFCTRIWFIFLYFQLDTLFFRLRTISAILFPLHVSGLTGPSSGGLNCTCSLWYYPLCRCLCHAAVERVLSQQPHDKDICRGGEYHRLHVQFRPPDDGPVRPETCRGKRIADIVCRRKNSVSSWK